MSKKSRKRNKKILAVLGALGGAALMARNKRNASIDANEAKESGFAASNKKPNIADVSGPIKDTSKSDVVAATPKKVSVPVGKMRGAGTDESAIAGQKTRADYARNARINALNTSEGSPMIDNPYKSKPNPQKRGTFKSGGKVRGCGIAKRGLGRAMKKGKR